MRRTLFQATALLALVLALLCGRSATRVQAQGYSGALPNVSAASGTSLRAVYTAGTVQAGGSTQAITADATGLLTTASKTDCAAPTYTSCNIIYWASSTALSTTTSPLTAFKPGQVVVAFVTTNGSDITAVYPASRGVAWPTVTYTDKIAQINPSVCAATFTTTAAASGYPKMLRIAAGQAVFATLTDTTGGTVTLDCDLSAILTRTTSAQGITITGVNLLYSVVTTTLTSIADPVLKTITGPAAGGSAAGVVADACGTLTYTPATGSIQKTAITSGTFYTVNISCGTPLAVASDVQYLGLGLSMVTAGSAATRFDIGGITVQYKEASF